MLPHYMRCLAHSLLIESIQCLVFVWLSPANVRVHAPTFAFGFKDERRWGEL